MQEHNLCSGFNGRSETGGKAGKNLFCNRPAADGKCISRVKTAGKRIFMEPRKMKYGLSKSR